MFKNGRIELIGGPMFSGKCHAKDTLILMADGLTKTVQNLKVGDKIMGDDSKPRNVLSISKGFGKLVVVKQGNGLDYVVNYDHILSLKNSVSYNFKNQEGKIVDIPVKEYVKMDIAFKKYYKGYRKIVNYERTDLKLDVYQEGKNNNLLDSIRINDIEIRKEWLVGFLEQYSKVENHQRFILKEISNDLKLLIYSVGLKIQEKEDKIVITGNEIYTFPWRKFKILPPLVFDRDELCSDIKIEELEDGEYYGFTIDGNSRYMLSDCTITHNTTELLRRLFCDASVHRRVLYINHSNDTRTIDPYSTHNPLYKRQLGTLQNVTMISCSILPSISFVDSYDTIGIDEGQFFDDLDVIRIYASCGKRIIVSGLVGDAEMRKFGKITDLIPLAEEYTSLYALCVKCAENGDIVNASFTKKILGTSENQIDIGGSDKYIPVCRKHHE